MLNFDFDAFFIFDFDAFVLKGATKMKLYIADAFTDKVFGGNPAGVVILDDVAGFPDAEAMRLTAAELRYSETAFIKRLSDGVFNIRYFTPADEVDLCGHATIASFHCLREAGLVKSGTAVLNKTLAGDLNIVVSSDSILMDMATPEFIDDIKDVSAMKELYEIMGIDYEANIPVLEAQCVANGGDGSGLKPEMISTGLPDIMMPVASREQLAAITPDFPALAELSKKYNVVGVHAFTLDGGKYRGGSAKGGSDEITAFCRNFAPLYDIDEEAATGTSNGALTYYLLRNQVVEPDGAGGASGTGSACADCLFIQGEAMERPSQIRSHITLSDAVGAGGAGNVKIQVGGSAVILAEGEIHI